MLKDQCIKLRSNLQYSGASTKDKSNNNNEKKDINNEIMEAS